MRYPIRGKLVLVTGGAGGIGRTTATELHRRGANVVICDLNQEAVEAVAAGLGAGRALPVAADVTDLAGMQSVVDEAVARFGGLDGNPLGALRSTSDVTASLATPE